MGIFPWWGKSKAGESDDSQAKTSPKKIKRNKVAKSANPSAGLDTVVRECEPGAAISIMRQNPKFQLGDNSDVWLILSLPVERIGGLSSKVKSDPDKGQIVELITADSLKTLVTADMLEHGILGFIPTEETLDIMNEFKILREANYIWGVAWVDAYGNLETEAVMNGTLDQAIAILDDSNDLDALSLLQRDNTGNALRRVSKCTGLQFTNFIYDDTSQINIVGETQAQVSNMSNESMIIDNEPDVLQEQETTPISEEDTAGMGSLHQQAVEEVETPAEAEDDADDWGGNVVAAGVMQPQYPQQQEAAPAPFNYNYPPNANIPAEHIVNFIERRIQPDDLDLVVSSEAFDQAFSKDISGSLFNPNLDMNGVNEWLERKVMEVMEQANSDLRRMTLENLDKLREEFIIGATDHADKVSKKYDYNQDNRYKLLREKADSSYENSKQAVEEQVAQKRKELQAEFDANAKAYVQAESMKIEQTYRERHQIDLEHKEQDYRNDRLAQLMTEYKEHLHRIGELRKTEAQRHFNVGITALLEMASTKRSIQREEESKRWEYWQEELRKVIEANRKYDIARADTLAEQLMRENRVEEMRVRSQNEINELRERHDAQLAEFENNRERERKQLISEIEARESTYQKKIEDMKQEVELATRRLHEAYDSVKDTRESLKEEYENRIASLEADIETYVQAMDTAERMQKRSNMILVVLIIALSIGVSAVGFILGSTLGADVLSVDSGLINVGSLSTALNDYLGII